LNGLKFFLGSSNSNHFNAINGYFYNARVYSTAGAFKGSASAVADYFGLINTPPSMRPGNFVHDFYPGETSFDNLNCGSVATPESLDWSTDAYALAESYAVWGWA
jgi:hypothetical protein